MSILPHRKGNHFSARGKTAHCPAPPLLSLLFHLCLLLYSTQTHAFLSKHCLPTAPTLSYPSLSGLYDLFLSYSILNPFCSRNNCPKTYFYAHACLTNGPNTVSMLLIFHQHLFKRCFNHLADTRAPRGRSFSKTPESMENISWENQSWQSHE